MPQAKKIIEGAPLVPIGAIHPYPNNPKKHSDQQIALLVGSLQEFGWTRPILVDEKRMILAGHGIYEAAKAAGETHVPIVMKSGLTKQQKRAYIIADNKLAERGEWDAALLGVELKSMDEYLIDLTGLKAFEIAKYMRPGALTDEEEDEPKPPRVDVKPGDIWRLDKHRLLCGDSTSENDVARLLGKASPHLMVTDPPYGVEYDAAWRGKALKDGAKRAEGVVTN